MITEMQVEESMIHFPYAGVDSPSSTVFGSPAISECGGGGGGAGSEMSVDPTTGTIHGCYVPSELERIAEFAAAEGAAGGGGGYEMYGMQQQSPMYPMADLDLKELENIIGPVPSMDVEHTLVNNAMAERQHLVGGGGRGVQPPPPRQQRPTALERSQSMSVVGTQPLRPQRRVGSIRVVSSSSPSSPGRASRTDRSIMNGIVRASKPIFPTESVPLQQVSRRPPSATPSILSTRSDPFDTRSICTSVGAASDPGYAYSVRSRDSGTGSVCSAPGILDSSTVAEYQEGPGGEPAETGTKACMEVDVNVRDVKRIIDLDRKILKLQAERAKLVEKASQSTAKAAESPRDKYLGDITKSQELVRIHLYFVPVGIHMLDEPVLEEANTLLRKIGGRYVDLERSIATLRHICCKGMAVVPEFSTCFAYIKSLLQETQRLQLTETGGVYQIELDSGGGGGGGGGNGTQQQILPQEFNDALSMANRVLHAAQAITHSYHSVQIHLQKVQGMARNRCESCDSLCQQIGLTERDRRGQIQSVLDGNFAMLSTAVRVWPQYYRAATETIRAITNCIHPTNT